MSTFEIVSSILSSITILALFLAIRQIKINRQQLYLATISKCIQDFRSLEGLSKGTSDKQVLWRYLDLVSEELFYFQHDYLPKVVSAEWIDGMIDFMPVMNRDGQVLNSDNCVAYLASHHKELLSGFPKIRTAFEVEGHYDFSIIYSAERESQNQRSAMRRRLIAEILRNIGTSYN